jgi:hypothetical protein
MAVGVSILFRDAGWSAVTAVGEVTMNMGSGVTASVWLHHTAL